MIALPIKTVLAEHLLNRLSMKRMMRLFLFPLVVFGLLCAVSYNVLQQGSWPYGRLQSPEGTPAAEFIICDAAAALQPSTSH
jgi:hypothetical protein